MKCGHFVAKAPQWGVFHSNLTKKLASAALTDRRVADPNSATLSGRQHNHWWN
jgi:hypothetical protein